jgi:hypothetical protein
MFLCLFVVYLTLYVGRTKSGEMSEPSHFWSEEFGSWMMEIHMGALLTNSPARKFPGAFPQNQNLNSHVCRLEGINLLWQTILLFSILKGLSRRCCHW